LIRQRRRLHSQVTARKGVTQVVWELDSPSRLEPVVPLTNLTRAVGSVVRYSCSASQAHQTRKALTRRLMVLRDLCCSC
jgi:hypothetical protein